MPAPAGLRLLGGFAALAGLAALAALAIPRGLADLDAFSPRQTLLREGRAFPAPADPAWAGGRDLLRSAIARDPANPNHHEQLAAWYERAALRMPARDPASRAYLEQSLEHLRTTAVLRPGSPYTWSNIALVALRLGATQGEMARAVSHAARLGPWEPEVQLGLAEVLFGAAEELPADARGAAGAVVVNALRRHAGRLFARASALGRLGVLCSLSGAGRSRLAVRCI
jgi:hypothetical protein